MEIASDPPPPPPKRSSSNGMLLALVPIILMSVGIFFFLSRKPPPAETDNASAFNISAVPEDDDGPTAHYTSRFEQDAARRSSSEGPLAGFVPEDDKAFAKGGAQGRTADAEGKDGGKRSRLREEEFIKKYDKQIRAEQRRYEAISSRYRKEQKIVKEVDLAFGKLPRYMALRKQYEKDRNAFAFVRNSVQLPEVRGLIRKYALKPETWRAAIGMSTEALKKKPPQPIYDEAVHFMTQDKTMTKFVTETTNWLSPRAGTLMLNGIPPGTDLTALKGIAGDIGAAPKTGGAPTTGRRPSAKRR